MSNIQTVSIPLKRIALLVAIPLALMSTGYALFSQQLSVTAQTTQPTFSFTQNLTPTYTQAVTPNQGLWTHTVTVTISNNGTSSVIAWQSSFDLPSDYTNVTCISATCSQTNNTNTAVNSNSTIEAGGTAAYSFTFDTSYQAYTFTNLAVSGTLAPVFQGVSGLAVSVSTGARSQSGATYTRPYTFTVTNNSGQDLAGWEITIPWNTTSNSVSSMPNTVGYTQSSSQLTILSSQALVNGANFQFTTDLSSTNANYLLSGYAVEGRF